MLEVLSQSEFITQAIAAQLANVLNAPATMYLRGNLGAGKTAFVRGFLQACGHQGKVKSPTYTLVESYLLRGIDYFHFDLYRLASPLELETIGMADYFHERSICLLEWPEKGQGVIPTADIQVDLQLTQLEQRLIKISADSPHGDFYLNQLDLSNF